ncbi:hypothetical protein ABMA57_14670 [Saccharospirillum sp. HFRX-1]|uniref:hypothetical protein n=1 Tax=unclassified Saccharospirillum TaxID=2633430 RepID=UPI0037146260
MDFFLKAKAWQVFSFLVGIPIVTQLVMFKFFLGLIYSDPKLFLIIFLGAMLIGGVAYLFWIWTLGVGINQRIQSEIRPKVKFFKFSVIYSAALFITYPLLTVLALTNENGGGIGRLLFLLQMFGSYCILYGSYFIAKNLVTFEKGEPIKFRSQLGTLILLWILPLGIWFIQPRINEVYGSVDTDHFDQ